MDELARRAIEAKARRDGWMQWRKRQLRQSAPDVATNKFLVHLSAYESVDAKFS